MDKKFTETQLKILVPFLLFSVLLSEFALCLVPGHFM